MQRQTAVTAYFSSEQLMLLSLAMLSRKVVNCKRLPLGLMQSGAVDQKFLADQFSPAKTRR